MKRSIFLLAILLIFQVSAQAQKKVLLNAMKDELTRSITQLKLNNEAGPYYLSYQVDDTSMIRIISEFGATMANMENRARSAKIDLRVGSYAQDNSNFLSPTNIGGLLSGAISTRLPLDDDYYGLRRGLWMATDRAYKTALETLSKKKGYLQNTIQAEALPDFTKGSATSSLRTENVLAIDKQRWNQQVDQIAKLFTGQPEFQRFRVILNVEVINSYYVNSEGAEAIEPVATARLDISLSLQAEDGMPLSSYRVFSARPDAMPDRATIENDLKKMISELLTAQKATLADPYSGPVLFVGQAAAELFRQGFSGLLTARRLPASDNPLLSRLRENPFLDRMNTKVAANFLSLKAVPTMTNYGRQSILGACMIDDEGVPCQDVSLIENGILKNLLTTRTPVKGFPQSNGHARGGAAAPSVIQIISANQMPYPQLKQALISAAKEEGLPFGYIVYGLTPAGEAVSGASDLLSTLFPQQGSPEPTQFRLTNPFSVFRIYPDGREEPVRGIEFGSIHINAFRNILATSDDETVYDFGVNASNHPATVITPSLLVGGIDLKKSIGAGTYPKLPIVSPPSLR